MRIELKEQRAIFAAVFLLAAGLFVSSCAQASTIEDPPAVAATSLFETTGNADYVSPRNAAVDASSVTNQLSGLADDWYKDSSFYHIWVKSFSDSNGDGCGDIDGITARLAYIQDDLGCDALWLSPIFECAGKGKAESYNMHGYDTVDYYAVNSYFGTEADVSELLAAAHARGMKVIFDFVPNHSSTLNQWFKDSANKVEGKEAWYLWSDEKLSWSPMGYSGTWYANAVRKQNYYAPFWSGMPDLNFRNVEVREEMKNVARYWLNRGFDGMRIDAVRYLVEEANSQADTAATHAWFQELRSEVVDAYDDPSIASPKFMVGEAWINGYRPLLVPYYGTPANPEFQMLFDFDFAGNVYDSIKNGDSGQLSSTFFAPLDQNGAAVATMLSNHDNLSNRPGTLYYNDTNDAKLRLATAVSLLLPTTPFIYYGNETGQPDSTANGSGDIRLRQNFVWSAADLQKSDPDSLLNLNKALLSARKTYVSIRRGGITPVATGTADVSAYTLAVPGQSPILCVFNRNNTVQTGISCSVSGADGSASTLIGADSFSVSSNTVTVNNLGPFAFRVYVLGETGKTNLFAFENAVPVVEPDPEPAFVPVKMYLRGTMNNWGLSIPMAKNTVGTDMVWIANVNLVKGVVYEFKFDASGTWADGQNWGGPAGNLEFTCTASGSYSFEFNWTAMQYAVIAL